MELAAVSISIAAGCVPCTRHHVAESGRLGADTAGVRRAIRIGAAVADAALLRVWQAFDAGVESMPVEDELLLTGRQAALCRLGSAVARNDADLLETCIEQLQIEGIDDEDAMAVVGLAERIKAKAAAHLDRVVARLDADRSIAADAARLCT
jgi:Carboxymuconolactone decarboxylase family